MTVIISKVAEKQLDDMPSDLRLKFLKHMRKISTLPPRRHLHHGIPYHVEDVTRSSRLIYEKKEDTLYVIRCFAIHKEYEKWYKSYS